MNNLKVYSIPNMNNTRSNTENGKNSKNLLMPGYNLLKKNQGKAFEEVLNNYCNIGKDGTDKNNEICGESMTR